MGMNASDDGYRSDGAAFGLSRQNLENILPFLQAGANLATAIQNGDSWGTTLAQGAHGFAYGSAVADDMSERDRLRRRQEEWDLTDRVRKDQEWEWKEQEKERSDAKYNAEQDWFNSLPEDQRSLAMALGGSGYLDWRNKQEQLAIDRDYKRAMANAANMRASGSGRGSFGGEVTQPTTGMAQDENENPVRVVLTEEGWISPDGISFDPSTVVPDGGGTGGSNRGGRGNSVPPASLPIPSIQPQNLPTGETQPNSNTEAAKQVVSNSEAVQNAKNGNFGIDPALLASYQKSQEMNKNSIQAPFPVGGDSGNVPESPSYPMTDVPEVDSNSVPSPVSDNPKTMLAQRLRAEDEEAARMKNYGDRWQENFTGTDAEGLYRNLPKDLQERLARESTDFNVLKRATGGTDEAYIRTVLANQQAKKDIENMDKDSRFIFEKINKMLESSFAGKPLGEFEKAQIKAGFAKQALQDPVSAYEQAQEYAKTLSNFDESQNSPRIRVPLSYRMSPTGVLSDMGKIGEMGRARLLGKAPNLPVDYTPIKENFLTETEVPQVPQQGVPVQNPAHSPQLGTGLDQRLIGSGQRPQTARISEDGFNEEEREYANAYRQELENGNVSITPKSSQQQDENFDIGNGKIVSIHKVPAGTVVNIDADMNATGAALYSNGMPVPADYGLQFTQKEKADLIQQVSIDGVLYDAVPFNNKGDKWTILRKTPSTISDTFNAVSRSNTLADLLDIARLMNWEITGVEELPYKNGKKGYLQIRGIDTSNSDENNGGWIGGASRFFAPLGEAATVKNLIAGVRSRLAFESLKDAKRTSANGASGFGALSNYELNLLKDAVSQLADEEGNIMRTDIFARNLQTTINLLLKAGVDPTSLYAGA